MKNESNNKDNNHVRSFIVAIILILLLAIIGFWYFNSYAKYKAGVSDNESANVAEMICEIEVQRSTDSPTIINPYCSVEVKNFDTNNNVTETGVQYTITVTPKGNFILPEFEWRDINGTTIAHSVDVMEGGELVGRTASFPVSYFPAGTQQTHYYTVVFFNPGVEDITERVNIDLTGVQRLPVAN